MQVILNNFVFPMKFLIPLIDLVQVMQIQHRYQEFLSKREFFSQVFGFLFQLKVLLDSIPFFLE